MASSITNISDATAYVENDSKKVISISDHIQRLNKIKYNLGLLYFIGLSVLLTTLLI
jgi:hypothetical protein